MRRRGFTLIELVIVIVILGILSSIALPKFVNLSVQAKEGATKASLGGVRSGIAMWYANYAVTNNGATAWPTIGNITDGSVMVQPFPVNPYNNSINVTTGTSRATAAGAGWVYNSTSGDFWSAQNNSDW